LKFTFLFMGKKRAGLLHDGIEDYLARIQNTYEARIISGKKNGEMARFLNRTSQGSYVIGLAEKGQSFNSAEFAHCLREIMERGKKEIVFLVGEADGLDAALQENCDMLLSLSPMTFNHRLARLVLLEQVYRALSIIQNTPYHR